MNRHSLAGISQTGSSYLQTIRLFLHAILLSGLYWLPQSSRSGIVALFSRSLPDRSWEQLFVEDEEPEFVVERPMKRRRWLLWTLFFLTFLSLIWTGLTAWAPLNILEISLNTHSMHYLRRMVLANLGSGLIFAFSLLGILTAHELGHYVMTRIYHVPSTPPIFIPFPISPIGTCGAVIMMDGSQADRKQIFDIGIAGPLAGLVAIVPVLIAGLMLDIRNTYVPMESFQIGQPLVIQWLASWLNPALFSDSPQISNKDLNPFLMAAWVGLLVTGLNMMPISQLDGGHVAFGLIGKRSIYIAVFAYVAAILHMIRTFQFEFALMLGLVLMMGLAHPSSRDDTRELGIPRQILGWLSLSIPLLCIPARIFVH